MRSRRIEHDDCPVVLKLDGPEGELYSGRWGRESINWSKPDSSHACAKSDSVCQSGRSLDRRRGFIFLFGLGQAVAVDFDYVLTPSGA